MKVYLIALFCVALLLLLVSFVMQQLEPFGPAGPQRLHLQQPGGGRPPAGEPTPAVRAGGAGRTRRRTCKSQVEEKDKQVQAMEWLRQIEAAVRSSYSEAKTMIEAFEETGLEESLPPNLQWRARSPRRCLPLFTPCSIEKIHLFHVKQRLKPYYEVIPCWTSSASRKTRKR